jgi:hypothetical protein
MREGVVVRLTVASQMLAQLRPALAAGMKRAGRGFVGHGICGTVAVISEELAQQLIAVGSARLEGDRLALVER